MKRNALDLRAEIFSAGDGKIYENLCARPTIWQFSSSAYYLWKTTYEYLANPPSVACKCKIIFPEWNALRRWWQKQCMTVIIFVNMSVETAKHEMKSRNFETSFCLIWRCFFEVVTWAGGKLQPRLRRHFNSPSSKALSPQFLCMSWSWKSRRRKKPPATFKSCYLFA